MAKDAEKIIEPEFDPAWLTPEAWDEDDDKDFGKDTTEQKDTDADIA